MFSEPTVHVSTPTSLGGLARSSTSYNDVIINDVTTLTAITVVGLLALQVQFAFGEFQVGVPVPGRSWLVERGLGVGSFGCFRRRGATPT